MKQKRGFTLLEMIIVIAIIGILTALIMPNFMAGRIRARDAAKKADMKNLKTALQLYYNDYTSYPPYDTATYGTSYNTVPGCGANATTNCAQLGSFEADGTTYMKRLPENFTYHYDNANDTFVLEVTLENLSDEEIAKSHTYCTCPAGASANCCTEASDYCVCPD